MANFEPKKKTDLDFAFLATAILGGVALHLVGVALGVGLGLLLEGLLLALIQRLPFGAALLHEVAKDDLLVRVVLLPDLLLRLDEESVRRLFTCWFTHFLNIYR